MKSLLSRFAWRRTIGLVIHSHQIALSVMATTPRGRREIFREVQYYYDEATLRTAVEKVLQPWVNQGQGKRAGVKPWVQVGLSETQVFQAVVPITGSNRSAPPQNFFLEAVGPMSLRPEDRIIDLVKLELNKQPLACLAACPRDVVPGLIEMIDGLGARVAVVEPAPAALCRAGARRKPAPRGSNLCVRIFLGQGRAIGVVTTGEQPLFWHAFNLTPGDEMAEIMATYSTLWMQGRHTKLTTPIDTVIVHGRPDLELLIKPDEFQERTGARLIRCDGPDFDPASIALGLALNAPLVDQPGHDLARDLKPPVLIRDIFPWSKLLLQGALVASVSLFLSGSAADLESRLRSARAELSTFAWLENQDQAKLDAAKRALQARSQAIQTFEQTRVDWSAQLRRIAASIPEATVITAVAGENEVQAVDKLNYGKPKKQLVISFATPLPEDGTMPPELHGLLAALRREPVLRRHFPLMEVAGLRAAPPAQNQNRAMAVYSIVCLPRP
jgi:hypothetical protein